MYVLRRPGVGPNKVIEGILRAKASITFHHCILKNFIIIIYRYIKIKLKKMNSFEDKKIKNDNISLIGLFDIFYSSKKLFILSTLIIFSISILYTFSKSKVYEASAILSIGSYLTLEGNVAEIEKGSQSINILTNEFIILKDYEINNSLTEESSGSITKISLVGDQREFASDNYILITSEGLSNKEASSQILLVIQAYMEKQEKNINFIKDNISFNINSIQLSIDNLTKSIALTNYDLKENIKIFNQFKGDISGHSADLVAELLSQNSMVTMFKKSEIQELKRVLQDKQSLLLELSGKVAKLRIIIDDSNFERGKIKGQLSTNNYPTKPDIKYHLEIGFLLSIALSIFIIILRNFLKKEE